MTERKHKQHDVKAQPVEQPQAEPEEEVIAGFRTKEPQVAPGVTLEEYQLLTDQLGDLQKQVEEAQSKAKEYFDGWQRERADFSNYKRRIEREQSFLAQNIAGEVIKKYLLVLDDMDRAMKMRPEQGDLTVWASGFELIQRKLQNILDAEGIKRIPAETEEFNPLRHEAISYEESPDHSSGQVIGVVQEGYTLGERVLRPARVRVAR
jgi:molecular chaperone GrpE